MASPHRFSASFDPPVPRGRPEGRVIGPFSHGGQPGAPWCEWWAAVYVLVFFSAIRFTTPTLASCHSLPPAIRNLSRTLYSVICFKVLRCPLQSAFCAPCHRHPQPPPSPSSARPRDPPPLSGTTSVRSFGFCTLFFGRFAFFFSDLEAFPTHTPPTLLRLASHPIPHW